MLFVAFSVPALTHSSFPVRITVFGSSLALPQLVLNNVAQTLQTATGSRPVCVTSTGERGVCVRSETCDREAGISFGACSDQVSVCCIRTPKRTVVTCGATVGEDDVVFQNAEYPNDRVQFGQCQITIKAKPEVCQLRIDFQDFILGPPQTCGPKAGYCLDDAFTVTSGVGGASMPVLCGHNAGQHMYVDVSLTAQALLAIQMSPQKQFSRRWSIRITQISCWSPTLAPDGCLQYHTKASDVITSFNFVRRPTGFHYFANLHYTICIRRQLGFCSVVYREDAAAGFSLSPMLDRQCRDAYLLVPTGSSGPVASGNVGDRFCGTRLGTIASDLGPFHVSFITSSRIGFQDCPCRRDDGGLFAPGPQAPAVTAIPLGADATGPAAPDTANAVDAEVVTDEPAVNVIEDEPQLRAEFRQVDDVIPDIGCRAGGFSLRYSQVPCAV
ncbi:uncharacterized protein LOC135400576 [Ornithodoros turicata]|uniref:uncharacterized protein LOC135400576 n=1 Tax=Ornithodoros turicata TaxID=34597 RepID=UPI0031393CF0